MYEEFCIGRVLPGLGIIFVDIFLIKAASYGLTSRNEFQLNADFRVHLVLDIMLQDGVELDFGQATGFSSSKSQDLVLVYERVLHTVCEVLNLKALLDI